MFRYFLYLAFTFFLLSQNSFAQQTKNPLLQKGWDALIKDDEEKAFSYFFQSYEKAKKENNTEDKAESLLYLGICTYGSSLENGLKYATNSLENYSKLDKTDPVLSKIGRSKCLQLISTIYTRQKKYAEAMPISREVISILETNGDDSGTLGLAYNSLGMLYELQEKKDSANFFYKLALNDFKQSNNLAYLPNAYIKLGESEAKNSAPKSMEYFNNALEISIKTENRQAEVSALIAIGKSHLDNKNLAEAKNNLNKANLVAKTLSDKLFEIKTLEALIELNDLQKKYHEVALLQKQLLALKEEYYSMERAKIVKSLEVQFEVAEKNRKLALISKENEVTKLTNYLLITFLGLLLIIFIISYFYFKKINKQDKQLLITKEALVDSLEKQKELEQQKFQNDLDHKENQLSSITLHMLQKNELLTEIKTAIDNQQPMSEKQLVKMVNRHFEQDTIWNDFDRYFESINKNFYTRLKQSHPEISANDLKICALIKLNLSIKEMATILNISPDSVKTSRYRLRKKLKLAADDNLTDFIMSV